MADQPALQRLDAHRWLLPRQGKMRTDGLIFSDDELIGAVRADGTLQQVQAMAALPGIVGPAMAMPDAHQGYGFPIGGVAAFDPHAGVVSPGGVGYDINCGVRLLRSKLVAADLNHQQLTRLADALAAQIPAGVGQGGAKRLDDRQLDRVLTQGAAWAVNNGHGQATDLEFCESNGQIPLADPDQVSTHARNRGRDQLGTLGAGNHFVELGVVELVADADAAQAFGLFPGQLVLWIHSGSRGLGHQVCDDYLKRLRQDKDAVHSPDSQLIAASPHSPVGQSYLAAMAASANFAFANRQMLTHLARQAIGQTLQISPANLGLALVYDVAHNIAKLETHTVHNRQRQLWVHRKGATRALGPNHPELPPRYAAIGQPVLTPGDMGRASYVLKGSHLAETLTFASSAHGAGRRLSRAKAKHNAKGRDISAELAQTNVIVRAKARATLAEEMPDAYKNVNNIAAIMQNSGVAPIVAKTRPLVCIKG
ncbi:protein of unknown function UPF0027 [Desulfarculus baarsii DSM 2075]|uniref:tRNA-splicing ligase RtcB n=1 Tax=Desulfarculus baarsii (strain ATCC 33931 / DSM 2075 / LMG 7858 / VKM B-1802 / 2st14) TaxID=644282 RepID=E1QGC5_DESB2|nr:RtcB family protein [Desulfarculus baarsii]ADK83637.1 protein of unknown function UPF0027 [Desulfarculus baarsii DSM 2075]